MIDTAIIGISGYAAFHLRILRENAAAGRARLRAATVINRDAEAALCAELEREGCEIFHDHESMLAAWRGRLGLCVIPTAPHWHERMAVAALEAGANVLLEKPLAPTPAEIASIRSAEARTGRWVAVGFQDLHAPEVHAMKRLIRSGVIGRLRRAAGRCVWPRPAGYYARNSWAGRLRIDGRTVLDSPLSNAMAHFPMAMLFVAGAASEEPARLTGLRADLRRVYPIESFDTFTLRGEWAGGGEFFFAGTHAGSREEPPFMVFQGEDGEICWTHQRLITVRSRHGETRLPTTDADTTRRALIGDVLRRCEGEKVFTCSTDIASAHAEIYHRLHATERIAAQPEAGVRRAEDGGQQWSRIVGVEEAQIVEMTRFLARSPRKAARAGADAAATPRHLVV